MALNRKRLKSNGKPIEKPVTCSRCKKKKAFYTIHGGWIHGGGVTSCDDCWLEFQKEEQLEIEKQRYRNSHQTEAEYQISRKYGI